MVVGDERVVVAGQAAVATGLRGHGLPVAGVRPPVRRPLTGRRDHPGEEHERIDRRPRGDQSSREPAVRLSDHDQLPLIADGIEHGVGVVRQGGRVVVAGQVGRNRLVPTRLQLRLDEVPVPADVACAVDQREHCHPHAPPSAIERRQVRCRGAPRSPCAPTDSDDPAASNSSLAAARLAEDARRPRRVRRTARTPSPRKDGRVDRAAGGHTSAPRST